MERHFITHYDSLKVTRDSPPEVIRAAYRALSQKYHPDRYPDAVEGTRMMQRINEAYAVLLDPQLRLEHNAWIAEQEIANADDAQGDAPPEQSHFKRRASTSSETRRSNEGFNDTDRFGAPPQSTQSGYRGVYSERAKRSWRGRAAISRWQVRLIAACIALWSFLFLVFNASGGPFERAIVGGVMGLIVGLLGAGILAAFLSKD